MEIAIWSVVIGLLLIFLALSGTVLSRLPLSTAMLYLGVGALVSPWGLDLMRFDMAQHTLLLERLTEIIVLVSLFTAGLKLSPGLKDRSWVLPLRLALASMVVTVLAIAAIAYVFLDLPPGACILLGGILAPTDPVLASDVQVSHPGDRDRLRFALTGEGGLNDGTAMPFVLLGLGLLGLHEVGELGWRWLLVDGLWSSLAGLGSGALLGLAIGKLVLYLRREHQEAVGLDDFLAMGLVALSYGAALLVHANGFLAVFAAGVALRHLEQSHGGGRASQRAAEKASAQPEQVRRCDRGGPAARARVHGPGGARVQRAGGAHRRTCGGDHHRRAAVVGALDRRGVVVRPLAAVAGAAVGRGSWTDAFAQLQDPALAGRLVRHPGRRFSLLSDVCDQPWGLR
jgi:sodium/hydrogen antiporter